MRGVYPRKNWHWLDRARFQTPLKLCYNAFNNPLNEFRVFNLIKMYSMNCISLEDNVFKIPFERHFSYGHVERENVVFT